MIIYRKVPVIQAMTFDLDDTLYDNFPVIQRVESEMAKWLHSNHPISAQMSLSEWTEIKNKLASENPAIVHDVTSWRKQQIEAGLTVLGYSVNEAVKASEEGIEHALWLRNQVDVPHETHRVMSLLADKLPLIAITNGNVDVSKIGLADYFQSVYSAGPNGRSKPCSDMFHLAQAELNISGENILHIGDHLVSDVIGANRAGLNSCWLNTTGQSIYVHPRASQLPTLEITQVKELLKFIE